MSVSVTGEVPWYLNLPLTQTQELGSLGFILKRSQCISFLNLGNDS